MRSNSRRNALAVALIVSCVGGAHGLLQTAGNATMTGARFVGATAQNLTSGNAKLLRVTIGRLGFAGPASASRVGLQPAAVTQGAAADLSALHAFPVPFMPSDGHTRITFRGLTANATVRVYALSGRLVQTLSKSDPSTADLVWQPVADRSGDALPSGVYFFEAEGDSGRAFGKLMIIR